jgi:quercetin dioxygenase-like cupin family protein
MNVYDVRALAADAVSARPDRPATAMAHDSADARIVVFRIDPGQQVPVHTSTSTVILTVVSGHGTVVGQEGERAVRAGDMVAYSRGEPHGMSASDEEQLVIAAVITPRP